MPPIYSPNKEVGIVNIFGETDTKEKFMKVLSIVRRKGSDHDTYERKKAISIFLHSVSLL